MKDRWERIAAHRAGPTYTGDNVVPIGDRRRRDDREAWQADRIRRARASRDASEGLVRWACAFLSLSALVGLFGACEERDTTGWWVSLAVAASLFVAGLVSASCAVLEQRRADRYFR